MLMEELHAEMCVGSQVIQDPLLSMHMTFLMLISSFSINLGCSSRDLAFHFSPRFNESVIVCNSKCADTWQTEHRDHHIPFYRGCTVKVRALCQHGLVGYVCGEGKPSVSRFPYHNLPSPTQYLLLPHNGPSSSGFLVLIAISTPPSKLQCCFGEYYVSPVCLTLCKCFLAPPSAQQVSLPGACMKGKRVSKKQDLAAVYLISLPPSYVNTGFRATQSLEQCPKASPSTFLSSLLLDLPCQSVLSLFLQGMLS